MVLSADEIRDALQAAALTKDPVEFLRAIWETGITCYRFWREPGYCGPGRWMFHFWLHGETSVQYEVDFSHMGSSSMRRFQREFHRLGEMDDYAI